MIYTVWFNWLVAFNLLIGNCDYKMVKVAMNRLAGKSVIDSKEKMILVNYNKQDTKYYFSYQFYNAPLALLEDSTFYSLKEKYDVVEITWKEETEWKFFYPLGCSEYKGRFLFQPYENCYFLEQLIYVKKGCPLVPVKH